MVVIKRNGSQQPFSWDKLENAIGKAFKAVGKELDSETFQSIYDELAEVLSTNRKSITVEELQDEVEKALYMANIYDVMKAYMLYRDSHKHARVIKERIDYITKYEKSSDNAANLSNTDANANSNLKNITSLESEVYKDLNRLIQRQQMKELLTEIGSLYRDDYLKDLDNHIIYQHDESNSPVLKPYCSAYTLYPLLTDGTTNIDGTKNKPPKHLSSFCGQFCNLVFLLSAQKKGAGAYGEFFNFFSYFCEKEWGKDYYMRADSLSDSSDVLSPKTIGEIIDQYFQQVTYYINQPAQNRGWQSPFTNFNVFDQYYWKTLFEDFVFPDSSKPNWYAVDWLQKRYMRWLNKERSKTLLTFPVITVCLLTDNKDAIDKEYKDFVTSQWEAGDSFFVYLSENANSLSSCCRLRNEITENTFSSTTGMTGVQTGSCNVMTLNLNRIVQNYYREKSTPTLNSYIESILDRVYDYQRAYKTGLYKLAKENMLPAVNAGYISLDRLYCTIGVNGLNEAARFLGYKVSNNKEYMNFVIDILSTIKEYNRKNSSYKFRFNLELVPAESLGVKNYNWDKEDGYVVPEDKNLYNSYIYDAHDPNTTILDKIKMQGSEIAKSIDGGQASHLNLKENLSKEQYCKLLEYAIKVGNSYITFNIPQSQCDDCNFIAKHPLDTCPNCGGHHITQWTRIIGYLKPISNWSTERQEEQKQRIYSY